MSDSLETDRLTEEFKRNTLSDDVKLDILFDYTRKLERVYDKLFKVIRRAKTAFFEDGSDASICVNMLEILQEAKE
jgi:hypothetical protein